MFNSLLEGDGYTTIRKNFIYYIKKKQGKVDVEMIDDAFAEALIKCQTRYEAGNIKDTSQPLNYFYRALYNNYLTLQAAANKKSKFRPSAKNPSTLDVDIFREHPYFKKTTCDEGDHTGIAWEWFAAEIPDVTEEQMEQNPDEFWESLDVLAVQWQINPHSWAALKYLLRTGCTYQELGALFGRSESTAHSRIKKLKEQIKELWNKRS